MLWLIQDPQMASRILLLFMFFLLALTPQTLADGSREGSGFKCSDDISKPLCLPDDYSKFELPHKNQTNRIGVSMDIDEVMQINDEDYSITISMYFNVEWQEPRLKILPSFGPKDSLVPTNVELVKDLWLPNIFIYNLKTFKVIEVLSKLSGLWIDKEKNLLYSQATLITIMCPMRFDKFPLDTQTCKFRVGSYSYDMSKMHFITKNAGYASLGHHGRPVLDYDIISIMALAPENSVLDYGSLGNFSLAGFEMVLSRHVSTYIITYFFPSGLFVIVSWMSFLIPMDEIGGRMGLLVILFLLLVNIFNTVATHTPKAECLTAIEVWMLACILFVFGALIEYAAILLKKQLYVSKQQKVVLKTAQQLADDFWRVDNFFLKCFPALFVVFNIVYWIVYLQ